MAKDQTPYFKHDIDASTDIKCKALRQKYGWEGQGWYWFVIEKLRGEDKYCLEYSDLTFSSLADDFKCEPQKVKSYIDDCISVFHLFTKTNNTFHSTRLDRDMNLLEQIRESNRLAGKLSGEKRRNKIKQPLNTRSADVEQSLNTGSSHNIDSNTEQPLNTRSADVELGKVSIGKYSIGYGSNNDNKNPFTLYQNNIGELTSRIAENIKDAETEYTTEWVCDAINRAVDLEHRNWAYIDGILRGWKRDGKNDGHKDNIKKIQEPPHYLTIEEFPTEKRADMERAREIINKRYAEEAEKENAKKRSS